MEIQAIKKAMGIAKTRLLKRGDLKECQCVFCFSDKTLLSVCQSVCDTSDKMEPKKELTDFSNKDDYLDRFSEVVKGLGIEKNIANKLANFICYEINIAMVEKYNQRREEDILWATKKMMGLEGIIAPYMVHTSDDIQGLADAIRQEILK